MTDVDITSQTMDGMGPHGTKVGLLRVLGPAHVWALGVGIVLVGEYMGWNFAVGKGGAYAALIACWFAGILYSCVAMIDSEVTSTVAAAGGQYTQAKHIVGPLMAFNVGLYLVFAYTMLEAANAITAGYLISVVAGMMGHVGDLDQRPFIVLVIMFLAWLNYRGVLATLTFNLVITSIAFVAILVLFLSTSGVLGGGIMQHAALFEGHELPYGWIGVLAAMHFGLWYYLGIEGTTQAAEGLPRLRWTSDDRDQRRAAGGLTEDDRIERIGLARPQQVQRLLRLCQHCRQQQLGHLALRLRPGRDRLRGHIVF